MEADIEDIDKHRNFMREALREVREPSQVAIPLFTYPYRQNVPLR